MFLSSHGKTGLEEPSGIQSVAHPLCPSLSAKLRFPCSFFYLPVSLIALSALTTEQRAGPLSLPGQFPSQLGEEVQRNGKTAVYHTSQASLLPVCYSEN